MHTSFVLVWFNFDKWISRKTTSAEKNPGGEINPFTYASGGGGGAGRRKEKEKK